MAYFTKVLYNFQVFSAQQQKFLQSCAVYCSKDTTL